jgi:hypothetical protein
MIPTSVDSEKYQQMEPSTRRFTDRHFCCPFAGIAFSGLTLIGICSGLWLITLHPRLLVRRIMSPRPPAHLLLRRLTKRRNSNSLIWIRKRVCSAHGSLRLLTRSNGTIRNQNCTRLASLSYTIHDTVFKTGLTFCFFSPLNSWCLCYLLHLGLSVFSNVIKTCDIALQKNLQDSKLREVAREKLSKRSTQSAGGVPAAEAPKYRDRASERRVMHNQPDIPMPSNLDKGTDHAGNGKKRFAEGPPPPPPAPPAPLNPGKDENNVGNKLLKMMGWTEGSGLGAEGEGRVDPM